MHIRGGYRAMTPIHVCNALAAYDDGLVRYRTLRTYFACVALLAVREAAARVRGERPKGAGEAVHAAELARLTGTVEQVGNRVIVVIKDIRAVKPGQGMISRIHQGVQRYASRVGAQEVEMRYMNIINEDLRNSLIGKRGFAVIEWLGNEVGAGKIFKLP